MSFKSWQSYWNFSRKLLHSRRYMHDEETTEFLSEVLNSSKSRHRTINAGQILWRSQLGGSLRIVTDEEGNEVGEESCPYPKERMCPRELMATEGRVNPKGIPCLYLATNKVTAMGESRPWIGTEISVAQFQVLKTLLVIDCSLNHSMHPLYFDVNNAFYEPEESEREKAVWAHIDQAFSQPVSPNENQAHYVPTQVIAELFKSNDFDGVAYKSMLGDGYNIALFDTEAAKLINCALYDVKGLVFDFKQSSNPLFCDELTERSPAPKPAQK